MTVSNKNRIAAMLKSIETGDPGPIEVINEAKELTKDVETENKIVAQGRKTERIQRRFSEGFMIVEVKLTVCKD